MVDCGGLENRYPVEMGSWVRIPLSPPIFLKISPALFLKSWILFYSSKFWIKSLGSLLEDIITFAIEATAVKIVTMCCAILPSLFIN